MCDRHVRRVQASMADGTRIQSAERAVRRKLPGAVLGERPVEEGELAAFGVPRHEQPTPPQRKDYLEPRIAQESDDENLWFV